MGDAFARLLADNYYHDWIIAALLLIGSYAALLLLRNVAVRTAGAIARKTATTIDDLVVSLIGKTSAAALFIAALFIASLTLRVNWVVQDVLNKTGMVALIIQGALWAGAVIAYAISFARRKRIDQEPGNETVLNAVGILGKVLIWTVVLLLMLDNLGFNITALVTGLGIGGIAVALALQNILSDLFASLSIIIDKPFVIGDFIVVDDYMGTIENIGLKTTRVRSLSGEQLVFSNTDLLKSRIRNFKRMQERRVVFTVNVKYDTPPSRLRNIPSELRRIIESCARTRFDRAHFSRFGDSALIFECVYYVTDAEYNL
ncbi:MAG: mechanosensitive ion channel family protein, partial [Acidobacteriota bacterium]